MSYAANLHCHVLKEHARILGLEFQNGFVASFDGFYKPFDDFLVEYCGSV